MSGDRLGRFMTFSSIGVLSVAQESAGAILEDIPEANPELVAEETLCMVATATARAAEVGLLEAPDVARPAADALLDLPFIYRDYLLGGELLLDGDHDVAALADTVYHRLARKCDFYRLHFPEKQFPGRRALDEKMPLWMGRLSPPGLPEMPSERLEKLGLIDPLLNHLKLVLAYGRKGDVSFPPS